MTLNQMTRGGEAAANETEPHDEIFLAGATGAIGRVLVPRLVGPDTTLSE